MMRERPILFSSAMVRAILDGRKTQTRRICDPRAMGSLIGLNPSDPNCWGYIDPSGGIHSLPWEYGHPGDRLWVQEAHRLYAVGVGADGPQGTCHYAATNSERVVDLREPDLLKYRARKHPTRPTPGRFMYRSCSRLTLAVESVRVERLHDITEEDARAEGVEPLFGSYVAGFAALWTQINGTKPGADWNDNRPWVWVIGFKRASTTAREGTK